MSNLHFSSSEIRIATLTLTSIAAIVPLLYFAWPLPKHLESRHVKTFNNFIQSFSTRQPQAITATVSEDFTHNILPQSLGLPSRTLQTIHQHAAMVFSLFEDFAITPVKNRDGNAVHFSPQTNTVIAHCRMGGKVNGASEMGAQLLVNGLREWRTEGVLFVRLTSDGRQVVEVREFVDSVKAEELQSMLGEGIMQD